MEVSLQSIDCADVRTLQRDSSIELAGTSRLLSNPNHRSGRSSHASRSVVAIWYSPHPSWHFSHRNELCLQGVPELGLRRSGTTWSNLLSFASLLERRLAPPVSALVCVAANLNFNRPLVGFTHACPSAVHSTASTPSPHCCVPSAGRNQATRVFRPRGFSPPRRFAPQSTHQFVAPGYRQGFAASASVHTRPRARVPRRRRGAHLEYSSHHRACIAAGESATLCRVSQRNRCQGTKKQMRKILPP